MASQEKCHMGTMRIWGTTRVIRGSYLGAPAVCGIAGQAAEVDDVFGALAAEWKLLAL